VQAEQDTLTKSCLRAILTELQGCQSTSSDPNDCQLMLREMGALLLRSCLLPYMSKMLGNESLLDVEVHRELYYIIFQIMCAIFNTHDIS